MATQHQNLALVADIGGTNVRFGLARASSATSARDVLEMESIAQFQVSRFASLVDAARHYLGNQSVKPTRAVLAVAGPINGDEVRITNNPWIISAADVRAQLAMESVNFMNDFAAMSAAIALMPDDALQPLGSLAAPAIDGRKPTVFAVIGPGTGLGVGVLLMREGKSIVLETEGGHTTFAPTTDEEAEIQQQLARRFNRVSNERLICGSGLLNVYEALCTINAVRPTATTPEEVTAAASKGSDREALRTMEVCSDVLASIAGDVVMTCGAWDGAYFTGGLIASLLPWMKRAAFRERFENKGRIAASVARVPTVAVLHPYAGLIGTAAVAASDSIRPMRWM